MARKLTAVLAGCGGMSRAWLGAVREMDDVEVVGLVDIVSVGDRYGIVRADLC